MEGETEKFSVISEIYSHFTEKNKENLMMIAESLLKIQKENGEISANITTIVTKKRRV